MTPLYKRVNPIFFQFLLVAGGLWFFHCIAAFIIERYNIPIHISSETIPIYKRLNINFNNWILLPIGAFGIYLFLVRSILQSEHPIPLPVLLALFIGLKVLIDVSVTMINGAFLPLGIKEYINDVPNFSSLGDILRNYASKAKMLTRHAGTHPPGAVMTLWLATRLFAFNNMVKAYLIIFSAPFTLIPLYLVAQQLYGRKIATYALALYLVTPNIVMYTATCMDAFFSLFLIFSVYLIFYSIERKSTILAVFTGLSLSLSMFMTFATTFLGVYFISLTTVTYFGNRKELKSHVTVLTISGGTFCLTYLIMYWVTGYNILTNLQAAMEVDRSGIGTGYESPIRYFLVSGTNLFGFFSMIGITTTTLWLRELGSVIQNLLTKKKFSIFLVAYVLTLVPMIFSTLYLTETERIWLFMAPFVLIPAAKNLKEYVNKRQSNWVLYVVIIMLCVQTLVFEVFIDTIW
ncbi:TPA: hypothetical protein EYN98_30790 [Candidatus Poribacteria bacterium]|nr:hypothetical protein [Candidatus Poribacteria bacterium]HIB86858.1 hypothetical protein [Candidatus Poribacteria bacterium]HIO50648.1 hypothetical protein [Candidatus Poribacteria bacterium]HIO79053.1 hypothetical protein [Candidatus Poribacteria bacterium]